MVSQIGAPSERATSFAGGASGNVLHSQISFGSGSSSGNAGINTTDSLPESIPVEEKSSNSAAEVVSNLQSAFAPKNTNSSHLVLSQAPSPGMKSGFVMSGSNLQNMHHGMTSGGVFTSRPY